MRISDWSSDVCSSDLARGQDVDDIRTVNAAPGYSGHHSGLALDIGTPGEPPAEESFEGTPAFDWLGRHAGQHGFTMSYPRANPHGIVYEPWHWRFSRLHPCRDYPSRGLSTAPAPRHRTWRSEAHTSELPSLMRKYN